MTSRLSATRGRNEFDADRIVGVDFDHRAKITTTQPLRGQIVAAHDDVETMQRHLSSPGLGRDEPIR